MIRAAYESDLARLQDIERAAGAQFRDLGMHLVADDEPVGVQELRLFMGTEGAWLLVDDDDCAIGYVLMREVDGWLYVEQLSVDPAYGRRGHGRRLIEFAEREAADRSLAGLALTSYVDVPWNGPYYERLGFRVVGEGDESPGMRAIRAHETERGLDRWPRAIMLRALGG